MDNVPALAAEIRRSVSGETWFGPSPLELLEGIDAAQARQHVEGAVHSIWQLTSHLSVWARYATYRFEGGVPRELDEENWPVPTNDDEHGWSQTREELVDAYERAAEALSTLSVENLDTVDDLTPRDENGEPVTLRRVAAGLAQHAAYHAGQIAVIKQLEESLAAPA